METVELEISRITNGRELTYIRLQKNDLCIKLLDISKKRYEQVDVFSGADLFRSDVREMIEQISGLRIKTAKQLGELHEKGFELRMRAVDEGDRQVQLWEDVVVGLEELERAGVQLTKVETYRAVATVLLINFMADVTIANGECAVYATREHDVVGVAVTNKLVYPKYVYSPSVSAVGHKWAAAVRVPAVELIKRSHVDQVLVLREVARKVLKSAPLVIAVARLSSTDAINMLGDLVKTCTCHAMN